MRLRCTTSVCSMKTVSACHRTTPRRANGTRRPLLRTARTPCSTLGVLFANGKGVSQDYAKAREWYEKAAAKDSSDAMLNLGALFVNGLGVPQDYTKAREWYEKAADKGDASAKMALERLPMREAAMAVAPEPSWRLRHPC